MKTTNKHFKLFKKECHKWVDRFQLNNYDIAFEHKKLNDAHARCIIDNEYDSTIALTSDIPTCFDYNMSMDDYIKHLAKHEVIHVLLGRVMNTGNSRYITKAEILEAEEELVRKLEKIIK